MNRGYVWWRLVLIGGLVACGGSEKKESNININPQLNPAFVLRVNVEGLDGQLVLTNHEGNPVTIASNGMMAMPSSWTQNSTYEVRVKEEPCLQRCVVSEPTGAVDSVGSKTLDIHCESKRWDLPSPDGDAMSISYSEAMSPALAMNRYGDALLSWFQSDGFNLHLYKREWINRNWSTLNSIVDHFSFDGSNSEDVSVALSDNMESAVVWSQETSTDFFSMFLGDKTDAEWQFSPSMLNVNGSTAAQIKPIARINSSGEKIAVWAQKVGVNYKLFKAEYRNHAWILPTSSTERISLDGSDVEGFDAAINDLGEIIIVWNQADSNGDLQVYKAELRNGQPWSIATSPSNNLSIGGTDVGGLRVAMNNVGDAYVVWHQKDAVDGKFQIFTSQTHNAGQTWDNPNSLSDNLINVDRSATYPKVVVNDAGQVAIMFRLHNASEVYQSHVLVRSSSTAAWPTSTKRLSVADFSGPQGNQAIGMDEFGNIVAVWSSNTSGNVYKAERRNGTWVLAQESAPINMTNVNYNLPAVAVNNCRAIIAWQQEGSLGQKQIFIQQYR